MKARYALLLAVVAGAAALGSAAAVVRSADGASAGDAITGTWTAEPATGKAASAGGPLVQLSLGRRRGTHGNSQHSSPIALAELRGLTADQMSAGASSVTFTLERDAGRFSFDGTFRGGEGAGHFTFTPRPEFVAAMRGLGYARLELDDLLSLRIHGASPEFARQLRDLGYERVRAEDLVSTRIHGVSPEFVRMVQASRGAVSIERLVDMRIHGQER
jgi:hypothetical protein